MKNLVKKIANLLNLKELGKRAITVIILTLIAITTVYVYAAFVEPAVGPSSSDQDFAQNILGANDGDNEFLSSSVAGNDDGSIIERLEQIKIDLDAVLVDTGTTLDDFIDTEVTAIKGVVDGLTSISTTTTGVIVEDGATGAPNVIDAQAHADANTFGNWVQVDAAVSADSWINSITITYASLATAGSIVVEVGTGAAASEVTKIRVSFRDERATTEGYMNNIVFPINIPIKVTSGTRIAARSSTNRGADDRHIYVGVQMYQGLE